MPAGMAGRGERLEWATWRTIGAARLRAPRPASAGLSAPPCPRPAAPAGRTVVHEGRAKHGAVGDVPLGEVVSIKVDHALQAGGRADRLVGCCSRAPASRSSPCLPRIGGHCRATSAARHASGGATGQRTFCHIIGRSVFSVVMGPGKLVPAMRSPSGSFSSFHCGSGTRARSTSAMLRCVTPGPLQQAPALAALQPQSPAQLTTRIELYEDSWCRCCKAGTGGAGPGAQQHAPVEVRQTRTLGAMQLGGFRSSASAAQPQDPVSQPGEGRPLPGGSPCQSQPASCGRSRPARSRPARAGSRGQS